MAYKPVFYTGSSCAEVANRVIWEKNWFDILPFKDETTNRPVNKYDDDDDDDDDAGEDV